MTPSPVSLFRRPDPVVCDVCQSEPALVTIGAVDYCARCAPLWHPSFGPVDAELDVVASCSCTPRGLEPVFTDPEVDGRCRRCGVHVEYAPPALELAR